MVLIWCPAPAAGPPAFPAAVRHLDALLRDYGTMRHSDYCAGDRVRRPRRSSGRTRRGERSPRWGRLSSVSIGRARPRGSYLRRPGRLRRLARWVYEQDAAREPYTRILREPEHGGADPRGALESSTQELVARVRRRGDRPLLPHTPARHRRDGEPHHGVHPARLPGAPFSHIRGTAHLRAPAATRSASPARGREVVR